MNDKNIKFYKTPAVAALVLLIFSFPDWNYSYYQLLKIVVTGASLYYVYYIYETFKELDLWSWVLIGVAILFNPIYPIYLYDKDMWIMIDIVVVVVYVRILRKYSR